MGENKKEKEMSSFPSSSSDAVTTTTTPYAVPADDVKSQAKESFEKKEAADGTAGADRLFETLVAADGGGCSSSSHHSTLNKLLSKP